MNPSTHVHALDLFLTDRSKKRFQLAARRAFASSFRRRYRLSVVVTQKQQITEEKLTLIYYLFLNLNDPKPPKTSTYDPKRKGEDYYSGR